METIAITGTTGFLGARASEYLRKNYSVVNVTRSILDITKKEDVLTYFDTIKPKYVIHSAAISIIDEAEKNPELSDSINRIAPTYIAMACKNIGAKLINMSSDQVYTGNKERYALSEDVTLDPQNLYAKQKWEAEKLVADILADTVSLRLTWMYDTPESKLFQHKAFLAKLLEAGKTGNPYKVNKHQLRSVTYIKHIIENLPCCFNLPGGVYNYGSENDISMYELCKNAASLLGFSKNIIELYEGSEQNILINTAKLQTHGIHFPTAMEGFTEAVTK